MGLVAQVASSAGLRMRNLGNAELIAADDMAQFLKAALSRDLCVLGLEGFRVVGDQLVPDMDAIADFSSMAGRESSSESVSEALQFLSGVVGKKDLLFDVTLGQYNN